MLQWHLEDLGDFTWIWPQGVAAAHQAHHWGDAVAADGDVQIQEACDFHEITCNANLLFGLTQRGIDGIGITFLGATTRKADLAGMAAQVGSAYGQQDR